MVAPNLASLIKQVGKKTVPQPQTKKSTTDNPNQVEGTKKRKEFPEDTHISHQHKKRKDNSYRTTSTHAIPISSEDMLSARLANLKINLDSLVGNKKNTFEVLASITLEVDDHFLESMDVSLLSDFCLHRAI